MSAMPGPMLDVQSVEVRFGGNIALSGVSFGVDAGEIVGIVGPNGSGKTTLLNCISAVVRPYSGRLLFAGTELNRQRTSEIIRLGIARTFQSPSLQRDATVLENVLFGQDFKSRYGLLAAALYVGPAKRAEARSIARVDEIIELVGLSRYRDQQAGDLPWALQKLVEIARALASEPQLLLLDEPTSGMTHGEKEMVGQRLVRIQEDLGITQILIEHDAPFVSALCTRLVALDFGKVIASGSPAEVLTNERVVEAYLGQSDDAAGTREATP